MTLLILIAVSVYALYSIAKLERKNAELQKELDRIIERDIDV